MERNVKIRLDGGNIIEKTITAVTFGDLKIELGMDFANQKVIVREGRHTLEDDAATLPLHDFNLFVYPLKVKSGGSYEDLGYAALRRLCIDRDLPKKSYGFMNFGTSDEMRQLLLDSDTELQAEFDDGCVNCQSSSEDNPTQEDITIIKQAVLNSIDTIQDSLDDLYALVESMNVAVIRAETDKLQEEFEQIRKNLAHLVN